ncbi:Glucose-methanol-choline oxidoreductase N-terminal [Trinorchestia longiramus]|nr:Glucose-methanol-choline oxidoreductase N-terminal [Trinorchestia longiramus]
MPIIELLSNLSLELQSFITSVLPHAFNQFMRAPLLSVLRVLLLLLISDSPRQFLHKPVNDAYDFVVGTCTCHRTWTETLTFSLVGGGAAGCVVASRLASGGASVLLLEAGGSAPPETAIPGLWPLSLGGDVDWYFRAASHPFSQLGYKDNASFISLGKMMGGSSSMTYYLYSRGHPRDYDDWAAMGNPGWAYNDVLPYFTKFEGFVKNESLGSIENFEPSESFGEDGPLRIIPRPFRNHLTDSFLRAGEELGYERANPNKMGGLGFHGGHLLLRNRIRETVAESFAAKVSPAQNLQVHTHATVTKILFDDDKKAIGVAYGNDGEHTVKAKKEVIVSAGALNTPKLLMLSGVGPVNHLQSMRIPVVAPIEGVGQNLHDPHSILYFIFASSNDTGVEFKDTLSFANMKYFITRRQGQLSRPFGMEATASVRLGKTRSKRTRSNVHYVFYSSVLPFENKQSFTTPELKPEIQKQLLEDLQPEKSLSLVPSLVRPKSRGWVYLNSKNPQDNPIIDFNFLSHREDIDLMIKAIRFAMKIAGTRSMQEGTGMTFAWQKLTSCSNFRDDSDEYWECFARHFTTSANNPMGTCKMGPGTDELSVVSHTLKVRGVSRLRVVDASIMPQSVSGPPLGTVIMIAEKASDLIKEEWGYSV